MDEIQPQKQREMILRWNRQEISENRDQIYLLMRRLGKIKDSDSAFEIISHLQANAFHRIYMQAGCIFFESQGDFKSSEEFLISIYQHHSDDPYVVHRYARSLFALARLENAREILLSTKKETLTSSEQMTVATTLTNMGFYDDSEEFLHGFNGSNENSLRQRELILRERVSRGVKVRKEQSRNADPIVYINLASDSRKRVLFEARHSMESTSLLRLEALHGAQIPEALRLAISTNKSIASEPGTVGCFISHTKAWEMLANGTSEFAIIIEDDGLPFAPIASGSIHQAIENVDILFINERLSSVRSKSIRFDGCSMCLPRLNELSNSQQGWGADGYVLTRSGAERLLELISSDLICGHLDGQLVSYCIGEILETTNRATRTASSFHSKLKSVNRLMGACLNFPLIHEVSFGLSSR